MIPGLKKRVFNFHDLMMYVAIGRKHLRLMSLCISLACAAGLVFFVYARCVYYSRSLVQVNTSYAVPLDDESVYHDNGRDTIISRLASPLLSERVGRRLGLHANAREITEKYIKKIAVKINPDGNLEVEVWAYSYWLARQWCEMLVDEFDKYRDEKRVKFRESIINSYTVEMSRISEKQDSTTHENLDRQVKRSLNETMVSVEQFKDMPAQLLKLKQRIAELQSLNQKLDDPGLTTVERLSLLFSVKAKVKMQVGRMLSLGNSAEDKAGEDKPAEGKPEEDKAGGGKKGDASTNFVVVPSVLDSAAPWEGLEQAQRRIEREIKEASQIYLPGHLVMRNLQKELEKSTRALDFEYELAKNRFDLELRDLENKAREAEAKIPEYEKVMRKYAQMSRESQIYGSKQIAFEGIVSGMSKKLELFDWTAERERTTVQFLDVLQIKSDPVSPNRLKIIIMALIGGLFLAIGIPFLIEYLDHTVSSFEEVESVFQLRGLGIIPQVTSAEQERPVLLDDENGDRNLVENFRVIRTNLLSVGSLSKEPQVIMVTSSMPKEGKTVVSSNLALSFAQTGAKTLLLDTDLRRGRLHRLFGLRKGPGLSGLLFDKTTLEEACRPTGKEGLSILTSGQHVESGTEMLGNPKFAEVMAELRQRYDRIIIDTPPVLGLSETSIIQAHADGVLFVIWGGRTPIRNMKVAVEMLQANGANFYGFILNRLDLSATTNYYQYYYYSNDYYHNYHAIENA